MFTTPLDGLLRMLALHADLDDADRSAISQLPYRVRRLDPGSYIVREGDRPDQCCLLVTGFAARQKLTSAGGRQIVSIGVPGDAVDFQNMFFDISDHGVQLLTPAKVADFPRVALQQLVADRPNIGTAIIQLLLIEASILREWVVNIGRRDARSRIAHLLCELGVRLEQLGLTTADGFELPMTQEQLADATGLTSIHVNRVLKSLESEGLIVRARRHVRFSNWCALQDAGDFSRRYLHIPHHDLSWETARVAVH